MRVYLPSSEFIFHPFQPTNHKDSFGLTLLYTETTNKRFVYLIIICRHSTQRIFIWAGDYSDRQSSSSYLNIVIALLLSKTYLMHMARTIYTVISLTFPYAKMDISLNYIATLATRY